MPEYSIGYILPDLKGFKYTRDAFKIRRTGSDSDEEYNFNSIYDVGNNEEEEKHED